MQSNVTHLLDALSGPLVVLGAAAILGVGLLVLRPLLLRFITLEVGRKEGEPIPVDWEKLLQRRLPVFRRLPVGQQTQLLRGARDLITTTRWEGCHGLTLTTEIQLIIAAQAALLALNLPADAYVDLQEILVYPSAMLPQRAVPSRNPYEPTRRGEPILGEAWKNGTVVIAWDAAQQGANDPDDGHNTVLHEFAHILDYRAGLTASAEPHSWWSLPDAPPGPGAALTNREAWHKLISENYTRFCRELEANQDSVIDPYGATNEAEFFAVISEAFFEQPARLMAEYPELFAGLKFFYRQDPLRLHP